MKFQGTSYVVTGFFMVEQLYYAGNLHRRLQLEA